ncbi:hypothetical protein [Pseudophaeobacter sp. C1-32P7]|uniref:hypothetical protein n=1 Tax=Pseudophaeobacter sp. C1-32P7 TaxID=3098142 RepID=UPI0034D7A7D3
MHDWPHTIPEDLRQALEAAPHEAWLPAFRSWAKQHGLRLKLQWIPDLERRVGELDKWRWAPGHQDRWGVMREWLDAKRVSAPESLPTAPERRHGDLGQSTPPRR